MHQNYHLAIGIFCKLQRALFLFEHIGKPRSMGVDRGRVEAHQSIADQRRGAHYANGWDGRKMRNHFSFVQ